MENIQIEKLIEQLQKLKDKGITSVQIDGTLMCTADGNTILASTIPQM